MTDRKQQIEQLMEKLHSFRRLLAPESPPASGEGCPAHAGMLGHLHNHIHTHRSQTEECLAPSQWLALHLVGRQEGIGIKELAAALGITSSAATQLADGLVKKGLLNRQPSAEDRRALHLSLPEESRKRIGAMMEQRLERMNAIFSVLDDAEFQTLLDLFDKIISQHPDR